MKITLTEWKKKFLNGDFEGKDFKTQCEAGWYDWFCQDSSLAGKTKRLGTIVRKLEDSEKVYVWFKNNCPMVGPLYDDFRIADIKTGDTLYTTAVADQRNEYRYEVYGIDNDFKTPLFQSNQSSDVVKFLNNKIRSL